MPIRLRAILLIFLTTLVIISFSIIVGIIAIRNRVEVSQEADLLLISDIADHFVSSEIKALKLKASGIAQLLNLSEETLWPGLLADTAKHSPEFTGISVWDGGRNPIVSTGDLPAPVDSIIDRYIQQAYSGEEIIPSVSKTTGGVVFCLAAPLHAANGEILILTLPGTHFSDLVSTFLIWETGHIFIDDADGRLVANPRHGWVEGGVDFTSMAEIDPSNENMVTNIRKKLDPEARIIRYAISGVPRLCAYRPVSESVEGWLMGVVAPLSESPFRQTSRGFITIGIVSSLLGLVSAIVASGFIKKPFDEIAALKEEAEAASRYKSEFLANMSHEIRTPMNTVLGMAEIMMQNEAVPQNINEGLSRIYSAGDMLLNIINDVLDLSKIEAGKLELSLSAYEAASLINDIAALNMMRNESKDIEFCVLVDENMPQTLFGDELRIKQIMNNLLSNAFKYTERGKVELSFAVAPDAGGNNDGATLIISVSDTGQGMTPEQIQKLFDQYARFNMEANRAVEGTGLGMSITRSLVDLMNGEIRVESEVHRGSTFTVRLPQKRIGTNVIGKEYAERLKNYHIAGARQIGKAQIVYEPMPYGKVLVVDDMESNLFIAEGLMLPYELQIETVTSGYDAIDRIKSGNMYDIVFMDHMMPEMDGIEAAGAIRNLGYARPIIALTANALKGQQEMFLANGFDDFVTKPIDTRRLDAVLKKYVRVKQPADILDSAGRGVDDHGATVHFAERGARASVTPRLAEVFVLDAKKALAVLEAISEKGGAYDEDSLLTYTTSVHAMKSVLANVGELELSNFAGKLEKAGRERDVHAVAAGTPAFLYELRKIIEKYATVKDRREHSALIESSKAYLNEKLLAVKQACNDYDRKAAKGIIAELREKQWELPSINELLLTMSEKLLSGDFAEVAFAADKIIEQLDPD